MKVTITVEKGFILNYLYNEVVASGESEAKQYVESAIIDSYDRLIAPSVEREIYNDLFDNACEGAITLFSDNLKHLLIIRGSENAR